MKKEAITSLNASINRFKEELCKEERVRNILDVAIVEFNSTIRRVQKCCPVEYMESVNLIANGGTDVKKELKMTIDMVRKRSHFYYEDIGMPLYKPWIVMITDGYPNTSIDEIAAKVADLEKRECLYLWSLAMEDADISILDKLCDGRRVLKLKGRNFDDFF
ncbi:hypothetical protein [Clostridium sp. OM05-9]|uniref:vWA domain-containing protein n=1 Tax=Clostridium sp. OM05-9 TaxID=2293045 RepID=UPI001A9BF12C